MLKNIDVVSFLLDDRLCQVQNNRETPSHCACVYSRVNAFTGDSFFCYDNDVVSNNTVKHADIKDKLGRPCCALYWLHHIYDVPDIHFKEFHRCFKNKCNKIN